MIGQSIQRLTYVSLLLTACGCTTYSTPSHERRRQPEPVSLLEQYSNAAVPKGNVSITIESMSVEQTDTSVLQAAVKYRGKNISATAGGLDIYQPAPGFSAAIQAAKNRSRSTRTSKQFLMLQPGTTAQMQILQVSRVPWTTVVPVYHGTVIVEHFREEVTGSGLTVRLISATARGLDIELTPYFNSHRNKGLIHVKELSTRVTVQANTPIVIMSDAGNTQSVNTGILSRHTQRDQHDSIVVLTARQ